MHRLCLLYLLSCIDIAILAKLKHIPFSEVKSKILAVDDRFCTEILLRNLLANAPTPDEMGKLSVFLKTASEEDLQNLSKPDAFCAEVNTRWIYYSVPMSLRVCCRS